MQDPIRWVINTLSGRKRVYNSTSNLTHLTRAGRHSSMSAHQLIVLDKRRAKNKVARKSRKVNRQRTKK